MYQGTDPGREVCLSLNADAGACTESFVGALAVVRYLVRQTVGTKSPAQSIRERVTLIDQSPGLPARLTFEMNVKLVNATGSDVQVFGYDETPLPHKERTAQRAAARTAWRRFRQELYLDRDRDPFAVIEWLHTIRGIDLLRVDGQLR